MICSKLIGLFALVALVMAHPPPAKKNGYSIVTHHVVEPTKHHQSEWAKPHGHATASSSWNSGAHGKQASSYSSLSTGAHNHASAIHASPLKPLAWNAPASGHQYASHHDNSDKNTYPKYKFDYGVSDPHTGDKKKQAETRHGDVVKGSYQINDGENGSKRVVEYSSNKHTGFLADVKAKIVKTGKW